MFNDYNVAIFYILIMHVIHIQCSTYICVRTNKIITMINHSMASLHQTP